MYTTAHNTLKTHALLSLGALLSRIPLQESLLISKTRALLSYELETAVESQNVREIIVALNAIGNAGPHFASLDETWRKVSKLLHFHDNNIHYAVFHSLRKFPIVEVIKLFTRRGLLSRDNALRLLAANYHTDRHVLDNDFPYNKYVFLRGYLFLCNCFLSFSHSLTHSL